MAMRREPAVGGEVAGPNRTAGRRAAAIPARGRQGSESVSGHKAGELGVTVIYRTRPLGSLGLRKVTTIRLGVCGGKGRAGDPLRGLFVAVGQAPVASVDRCDDGSHEFAAQPRTGPRRQRPHRQERHRQESGGCRGTTRVASAGARRPPGGPICVRQVPAARLPHALTCRAPNRRLAQKNVDCAFFFFVRQLSCGART